MTAGKTPCIVFVVQKTSDVIWQDAQHQVLFELLDEVGEPGSAIEVMRKLKFYAETHFALEEEYMRQLDYPGRDAHVRAHDHFREELQQMALDAEAHDDISRQVIATFLREWLTRHIFGIDKDLEAFLLASNIH